MRELPESPPFEIVTDYRPTGDQPAAIKELVEGIREGEKFQTLLGVTGSGKTFTVANVIAQVQKPSLILAPNKTLAAQLYSEFKNLFPKNAVEYFVSYYDFYQPEAYIPATDTFIEKDSAINDEIDKLRHSATRSLFERKDVIIVSSVSCIYGLGSPEAYLEMLLVLDKGTVIRRDDLLRKLIEMSYTRSDIDFHRGTFRVRGDLVDIFPSYESNRAIRLEFFGSKIEKIFELDPIRGTRESELSRVALFPGSHYVASSDIRRQAILSIQEELRERLGQLRSNGMMAEAQRLEQRTLFDIEMMQEMGYCPGIENYSRHLSGRKPGEQPPTLLEYFPKDWLLIADESHVSVPQVGAMYKGDLSRKSTLVQHGFRMPSALDNRPLKFEEFENLIPQAIFVSATPADYEIQKSNGHVVEQIIRPTGLLDPTIEILPAQNQVVNALEHARARAAQGERVLVTTLTKKMAEDLSAHFRDQGMKVKYLHSDIDTLERVDILKELRVGKIDVLVGINLLREGLDLPEVSLVMIMDADKEGFLRSRTSLIQTFGRAARNAKGHVILYADRITRSMREAIDESTRRRQVQADYNKEHGITPVTVNRIDQLITDRVDQHDYVDLTGQLEKDLGAGDLSAADLRTKIQELETEMRQQAKDLNFEKAANIRDQLLKYKELELKWGR